VLNLKCIEKLRPWHEDSFDQPLFAYYPRRDFFIFWVYVVTLFLLPLDSKLWMSMTS